mmetsp:Transcript_33304/g.60367  ORF Transcript_33304/g.60367 Transcript_33304/m.60367 type:complete len:755 (+) Transcript_33304:43-2307(+)
MAGRSQLIGADPVYALPLQTLLVYSIIGLVIVLVFPISLFYLAHEVRVYGESSIFDKHLFRLDTPIWAALVAGCVAAVMHFYLKERFMDRIFGTVMKTKAEDQSHCTSCKRLAQRLRQILLWLCIPVILTWTSPCLWWSDAADLYTSCSHACSRQEFSSNQKTCSKVVQYSQVSKANLTVYDDLMLYNDLITKRLYQRDDADLDFLNTQDAGETLELCSAILNSNKSAYAADMQKMGQLFAAFESLARQHYRLSVCDVTGSIISGIIIVLWLAVEATKKKKIQDLREYKQTFLWENVLDCHTRAQMFARRVRYLYVLMYGKDRAQEQPVVKMINRHKLDGLSPEKYKEQAQEISRSPPEDDKDLFASHDEESFSFDGAVLGPALPLALIHVLIPAMVRLCSDHSDHSRSDRLLEALLSKESAFWNVIFANMVSGFCGYLVLFSGLISAAFSYQEKKCQLLAFKCMWKFPDDDPQRHIFDGSYTVMKCRSDFWTSRRMENKILIEKDVETLLSEDQRYLCDFSIRDFEKLTEQDIPEQLSQWLYIRRFIQLDAIDERISIELYSSLAIMVIVYKLGMTCFNWLAVDSDERAQTVLSQTVNWESMYDSLVILYFLLKSLTLTLAFNDEFEQHHDQLRKLREHIKRSHAECWAATFKNEAGQALSKKKQGREAEKSWSRDEAYTSDMGFNDGYEGVKSKLIIYIDTLLEGMEEKDHPATIFGLQVNRKFITTLSVSAVGFMSPLVFSMLDVLKKSDA